MDSFLPRALQTTSLAIVIALAVSNAAPAKDAAEGDPKPKEPIAKQILGTWGVDIPKTLAAMIRRAKLENGGRELEEGKEVRMATMVNQMAESLQLDFIDERKVKAHQPNKTENASYQIIEREEESGEFTMSVTSDDEKDADTAKCKVSGDHLVMGIEKGKAEIHLKRLTRDEAKAHLEKMRERKPKGDDFDKELGEELEDPDPKTEKKD